MRTHISVVALTFALSFMVITPVFAAWVDNSSVPPQNNASAPIHVGTVQQKKLGILEVLGGFFTTGLRVTNNGNAIIDGKVGVGTTTPSEKFVVVGNGRVTGSFRSNTIQISGGTPTAGKVLTATDALGNSTWQTPAAGGGSSQWITSGTSIYYNTGNVGIGTMAPAHKLDIGGDAALRGTGGANAFLYMNGSDRFGGGGSNLQAYTDGALFIKKQNDTLGTVKVGEICLGGYTGEACRTSWPSGTGGTVGPVGPQGPAGVSTTYTKQAAYSGGKGSVSCNSGDVALGGGISQGASDTATGNWSVAQSRPEPTSGVATGWYCSGEAGQGRCYVICLDK